MLKCKIHRMECFDLPTIRNNSYYWSNGSYVSILDNPHITATLFHSRERWACIIRYFPISPQEKRPLSLSLFEPCAITDIYQEFASLESEGILIELVSGDNGSALRAISSNEGSIPIYFSTDKKVISLDWDFRKIALAKNTLTLDFEYLVKSSFEPTYTNRTAFQGISMLTAGASVTFSDDGCDYKYPTSAPARDIIHTDIRTDEAIEEFSALLEKKIHRQLKGSRSIAIELSGGLDSSTVAVSGASALPEVKSNTYGIIVSDPLTMDSQKSRRSKIIDFIKGNDYETKIKDHLPSLTSSASDKYYLNSEAYADAFNTIWRQAKNDGHTTILNGCGGDELFPQFANEDFSLDRLRSIDDKSWHSYNTLLTQRLTPKAQDALNSHLLSCAPQTMVDTGTLLAMARRAPLLLNFNLIPLYPLRDNTIINFCSQLPLKLRLNKYLLERVLQKKLGSTIFCDYPKETFMHADETALLLHKQEYLVQCRNFKTVEIGLIDATTIKQDIAQLTQKTPRHVYDYLLNILAIERFLEAYL